MIRKNFTDCLNVIQLSCTAKRAVIILPKINTYHVLPTETTKTYKRENSKKT